jgi:hypothetical protein
MRGGRRLNVTAAELNTRLVADGIVRLTTSEWEAVAGAFEQVECHRTFVAGDLLLVQGTAGWVVVEQPLPEERVARLLPDKQEARRFAAERLEQYERMWDGCGCKIDYYCAWPPADESVS